MPAEHPKHPQPDYPILEAIAKRWSPYAYDPRSVEPEKLAACLEAARWAASSYNEQPWRFFLARREEEAAFAKALGCLLEANQAWATHAGVLMLTAYSKKFAQNGKPNRVAFHDLGLALGNLSIQATALGLHVHQMAGVDLGKVRREYAIPEDFEPATAVAIGYAAAPGQVPEALQERDLSPRQRKPFSEFVFQDAWGQAARLD